MVASAPFLFLRGGHTRTDINEFQHNEKSLNSDGPPFHQYYQSKTSPLTSTHCTTYDVSIPGLGFART